MRSEIVIDFLRPGGMANALCPPFFLHAKGATHNERPLLAIGSTCGLSAGLHVVTDTERTGLTDGNVKEPIRMELNLACLRQ